MEFSSMRVSICLLSSSSSYTSNRFSGFSLTSRTFLTMRSMGLSTSVLASLLKSMAPRPSTKHTNALRPMFSDALSLLASRMSKNA